MCVDVVRSPFSGLVVTSKCFVGDRLWPLNPMMLDDINFGDADVGDNETHG